MGSPNIGDDGFKISVKCLKCGSDNVSETYEDDYDCVYICNNCGTNGNGDIYLNSRDMFFVSIKNASILRQAIYDLYEELAEMSYKRKGRCDVYGDMELIDEYDLKEVTRILNLPKEEQLRFQDMNILVSSSHYSDAPLDIKLIESAFSYKELTTYEEIFSALHENLNPLYIK